MVMPIHIAVLGYISLREKQEPVSERDEAESYFKFQKVKEMGENLDEVRTEWHSRMQEPQSSAGETDDDETETDHDNQEEQQPAEKGNCQSQKDLKSRLRSSGIMTKGDLLDEELAYLVGRCTQALPCEWALSLRRSSATDLLEFSSDFST